MLSSILLSTVLPAVALALVVPKSEGFAIPISKRSQPELQGMGPLISPIAQADIAVFKARATGADPLIDNQNNFWYGSVSIGTPATAYNFDFDTGSNPFYVALSNCTVCSATHKYNPASSTTNKNLNKAWAIAYVDGSSVSGWTHTDTVTIGGLTTPNQLLGGADAASSGFFGSSRDGMMGLGWPSTNWPSPFIYTLYTLGVIPRRQFALKISNTAAELYFGGANAALYSGSIYWNPIVTANDWSISLASVQVGTSQVVSTASHALIDSGTSVIYGPAAYVSAIFAAIPGSAPYGSKGGYTYPCSADPGITFTFNGKSWPFPVSLLEYSPATGSSTLCYSNIKGWSSDYWILGDAWMKSVYAVYDYDTAQIGFAALA